MHEYTGIINITGKREGVVYFTAPKAMLTVLLMKMQESDFSHETMRDLVGEVANTISGNARRDFGRDFVISVPSVLSGEKPAIPQKPGHALLRHPHQLAQPLRQAGRLPQLAPTRGRGARFLTTAIRRR